MNFDSVIKRFTQSFIYLFESIFHINVRSDKMYYFQLKNDVFKITNFFSNRDEATFLYTHTYTHTHS